MRGYPVVATTFLSVLAAAAISAQEVPKVAVIDVQQVVEESAAGKEAMARLQRLQQAKSAEARALVEERDALVSQLQAQRATLSDTKISELQKQIEDKEVALKRFEDDAQRELAEARRKELQGLENQILPIINELGREMQLQLIFNKFQSGLVYADEAVDVTAEVLKRFNTRVTQ